MLVLKRDPRWAMAGLIESDYDGLGTHKEREGLLELGDLFFGEGVRLQREKG